MDGKEFPDPINADIVKKYYAWSHQKKDLSELKIRKGDFGKKREKKRETFKVKTWKGSFKKKKNEWKKWKRKMRGQVENPKGRPD